MSTIFHTWETLLVAYSVLTYSQGIHSRCDLCHRIESICYVLFNKVLPVEKLELPVHMWN